ncbi:putative protodermal factor 1 [Dioscorea sansibarensis]
MGLVERCLVLLLVWFGAAFAGEEEEGRSSKGEEKRGINQAMYEMRRPGFLYTRNTGRCTPQYWSSGREMWPSSVPEQSAVYRVFGSRMLERYERGMTLFEAIQKNDDIGGGTAFTKLIKQSSAALLNAYTRPGFRFASWEVKTLLLEALISEEAAASQAEHFTQANSLCS